MNVYIKHLKVVCKHKYYVMQMCFKCGLYKQGILHDLSKFSPIEFFTSARYFSGDRSPIDNEKDVKGYSIAWLHHKSNNKHHWQYWLDNRGADIFAVEMPREYVAEMLCDWYGASRAYNGASWDFGILLDWIERNINNALLHENVKHIIGKMVLECASPADLINYIREIIK